MKIQPEAHNAIEIILDDGSMFCLHETAVAGQSHLFINAVSRLPIEVARLSLDKSPEWVALLKDKGIRIRMADEES